MWMIDRNCEDEPRRVSVFFYGLFMDIDALRLRGFDPINERQACVEGMELRLGRRARQSHEINQNRFMAS